MMRDLSVKRGAGEDDSTKSNLKLSYNEFSKLIVKTADLSYPTSERSSRLPQLLSLMNRFVFCELSISFNLR